MNLSSTLRNAGTALIGNLLAVPFSAIAFILIARNLGAELLGVYTFALDFSFIFASLSEGGLSIIAVREIARNRDQAGSYLGNLFLLKLALSLIFYGIMLAVGRVMFTDNVVFMAIGVLGAANFLFMITLLLLGVFRAFEKMKFEGVLVFIQAVIFMAGIIAAVYVFGFGKSLAAISGCFLLSYMVVCLVGGFILFTRLARPRLKLNWNLSCYFLLQGAPIAVSLIISHLISRVSVFALQHYWGPVEVGQYNVAFRLSFAFVVIAFVLSGAWMPGLARSANTRWKEYHELARQFYRTLLLISMPVAVALTFLAEPVTLFLYGPEYEASVKVLQIVIWSTLILFVNTGHRTLLESCNRQTWWTVAISAGLIANVILNYLLVPLMSIQGAAIATVGGYFITSVFAMIVLHLRVKVRWNPLSLSRIILSCIVMSLGFRVMDSLHWIPAGIAGFMLYAATLLVIREVSLTELLKFAGQVLRITRFERK